MRGKTNVATNPNTERWKHYGGNNPPVRVCKSWFTFENFLADMGPRPSTKHSLGRILDMGNYEPSSVFWQTRAEQSLAVRNKRASLKWSLERETAITPCYQNAA